MNRDDWTKARIDAAAYPEWIYRPLPDTEFEKTVIEPLEKAIGFKLFFWQKAYLLTGHFRQYGESTARALSILLDTDAPPLDFRLPMSSRLEVAERQTVMEIQKKLDVSGISTREIKY